MLAKDDSVTRRCAVPGCEKKHKARGYCEMHDYRVQKWGTPDGDPAKANPSQVGPVAQTQGPKVCSTCGVEKSREDYSVRTGRTGARGYNHMCKDCAKAARLKFEARYKARVDHTPPDMSTCTRCSRLLPSSEFVSSKSKARGITSACKECFRARYFGITRDDVERLLDQQGGVCAICGQPCPRRGLLSIDHDHGTGEVRGLLCSGCNLGLGHFADNPDRLVAAAAYLLQRTNVLGAI